MGFLSFSTSNQVGLVRVSTPDPPKAPLPRKKADAARTDEDAGWQQVSGPLVWGPPGPC